jgi:hypothetical protein
MVDLTRDTSATGVSAADSVRALLEGGPESFPSASRIQEVGPADQKIKIQHCGGYEHFERVKRIGESDQPVPGQPPVFRWTMRTEMAE